MPTPSLRHIDAAVAYDFAADAACRAQQRSSTRAAVMRRRCDMRFERVAVL